MVCIYCSGPTSVTNSRPQKRTNHIWRRRTCDACKAVFSTIEAADLHQAWRVRTSGRVAPFLREKLLVDVYTSLGHRKTALPDAIELTNTIIKLLDPEAGVIEQGTIITLTHAVLENFDTAAATHYAAYHPIPG